MSDPVPAGSPSATHEQGHYQLYWLVFIVLCVCTALSFVFNVALGHGAVSATLISIVAIVKAALVVLIFMHVKYTSEKMTKAAIIAAIFFLGLLLTLSLADFGTRAWL